MAKFCINCGKPLEPGEKSCKYCGTIAHKPLPMTTSARLKPFKYTCLIFLISLTFITILTFPYFHENTLQDAVSYAFYTSLLISSYIAIFIFSAFKFSKYSITGKIFYISFWIFSLFLFVVLLIALPVSNLFYRVLYSVLIAFVVVLVCWLIGFIVGPVMEQEYHYD